jgi:hypothetical protein
MASILDPMSFNKFSSIPALTMAPATGTATLRMRSVQVMTGAALTSQSLGRSKTYSPPPSLPMGQRGCGCSGVRDSSGGLF